MDKFDSMRIARHSESATKLGVFGPNKVESHEWRRGQDIGKRRTTFGIYGTENDIRVALKKANESNPLRWNRFHNGKCMVW